MKRLIFIISALCLSLIVEAQEYDVYKKGYKGTVAVGGLIGVTRGVGNNAFSLTTTHSYGYGNGLSVGAGVGLSAYMSGAVSVPVFTEMKYNILDCKICPFVDCRVGGEAMISYKEYSPFFFVSPGFGVDCGRFNLRAAYLCEAGILKLHSFQITVGILL